ncbi:MAG: adenine deaminase [Lentisphaerae bacterium RIFOXYB12_FULL_65_16]|nr:MAG: adenine deaminase [Lentisphaerae bacterium RIFOXYA12_64_32]OGV87917.1 MAG: adenine deaminase [Lentisphaerae bacterium RIFOXYB12_FULL_65_16]
MAKAEKPKGSVVVRGGRVIDVDTETIIQADIVIRDGLIEAVYPDGIGTPTEPGLTTVDATGKYVAPGFIDAHVHIESSMLSPLEFATQAMRRGTTAMFIDPHDAANVRGRDGITYLLEQADLAPCDIHVAVPSCVPGTDWEDSGATITVDDVRDLIVDPRVYGLGEMKNWAAVIDGTGDSRAKVDLSLAAGKLVDGHCPKLTGDALIAYATNGYNDGLLRISSDHECASGKEALERIRIGMMVAIREGTANRDMSRIIPFLIAADMETLDSAMFCSDDLDVEDLLRDGHLDRILRRAIALMTGKGGLTAEAAAIRAIRMATRNPARHFRQSMAFADRPGFGEIDYGFKGDLVVFNSLRDVAVEKVIVNGLVMYGGEADYQPGEVDASKFKATMNVGRRVTAKDFAVTSPRARGEVNVRCMTVREHSLVTTAETVALAIRYGQIETSLSGDVAKVAVLERYHATGTKGLGFVHGFGLHRGAIASTVAHDSHNLIVVGTDDQSMADAANTVIEMGGGMAIVDLGEVVKLPLPLGGLMIGGSTAALVRAKAELRNKARDMGSRLQDPFTTLSFLSMPAIPDLKLTNRGLIDVKKGAIVELLVS